MTDVTVTSPIAATCHYYFYPQAKEDTTGLGVIVPAIVYGWFARNVDGTPATLSVVLDSGFEWDVDIEFHGAPPVVFNGFQPANGDLLTQLAAQGWVSL